MKFQNFYVLSVLFLLSCTSKPTLKAVKATRTQVESTVTTTSSGTIESQKKAVLGFGIAGRVHKISVKVGQKVTHGEILAELENLDLKTMATNAKTEISRAEELFKSGLFAQAALDEAKKNYQVAQANLDKTLIRAPFDGLVTEVNLEIGELSQPTNSQEKPPIRLIDLNPRIIKGNIDEVDLSKIKTGSRARVRVPAVGQKPFDAVVTRVVPFVSTTREQDRTSEIELKFQSPEELIAAGASADIEVIAESKPQALAVPTRVILGRPGQRYVFRYQDGRIKKAPVQIGVGNYDRSEILSGISSGEGIIFPPDTLELSDGMKVAIEWVAWP
jgi:HlyD family secretion protein